MAANAEKRHYRPTESQYKGKDDEMYVTYDLEQKTRGDGHALYAKVKRVYIAGDVRNGASARSRSGRGARFTA